MRRMSRCVTGVPLPGWMFSAFMTTHSLPSMSSTLPLRTELAITLTTQSSAAVGSGRAIERAAAAGLANQLARFLQAFFRVAKEQGAVAEACAAKPVVGPPAAR